MYVEKSNTGINIMDMSRKEAIVVRDALKYAISRLVTGKENGAILSGIAKELEPLCSVTKEDFKIKPEVGNSSDH